MPTRSPPSAATGFRVHLRAPRPTDERAFLRAARASRALHGRWAKAPSTRSEFVAFVKRYGANAPAHAGFLVLRNSDDALCGVFNFSEIVRNAFNSAYLGYYAFAPHAGDGLMTEGFALALDIAFRRLALHRIEVNVQPTNRRSLAGRAVASTTGSRATSRSSSTSRIATATWASSRSFAKVCSAIRACSRRSSGRAIA